MPILILGLVGFALFMLLSVLWVALSVVVALFWLALPVALIVLGASIWRARARRWQRWNGLGANGARRAAPFFGKSGNVAFDDYKAEALGRLDEEREKFGAFLEQRRQSRDKQAFDSFNAERRADRPAIDNGATA